MPGRVLDIDHVMVHVHDSQAAGEAFEALGFYVTPKSEMTALGLSNRCILFQPDNDRCANFIELMAIEVPDTVPPFMKQILGTDEGPVSLVMATDDVDAMATNLRARNIACIDPFQVKREWRLADDDIVHPAFGVCIPEPGQFDPYWNLCQYHTRELYVRPDLTCHPNGAQRIKILRPPVNDPQAVAESLATAWDTAARDGSTVRPGSVALSLTGADETLFEIGLYFADDAVFDGADLFGLRLTQS